MNDSDFHSIFNFELNQGYPISNCLGVELLWIKSCRQEFKKVPFTQGNWVVGSSFLWQAYGRIGPTFFFHGQRTTTISLILEMLEMFDIFRISKQYMSCQ